MENSFEESIFNTERDRPMSWFLKQKDRLTSLHPDMLETMINKRILRKCGGDLEHAIRIRCIEPCSTKDDIDSMEDITTVVFHTFFFTRFKLIVPYHSRKSSLQADLHSNFTPK
ncbi:hypothetical protein O181_110676, partial [Austropuccinia psidii MF-1]|nr:hypothetical protein [Austropuccinia psidii MF-1]